MLEVWCQGPIAFLPLDPFLRSLSIYWLTQLLSSKISTWLFSRVTISLLVLSATSFSLAVYLQPVCSHQSFLKISLLNSPSGSSPISISLDLVTEEWKAFGEVRRPSHSGLSFVYLLAWIFFSFSWGSSLKLSPEGHVLIATQSINKQTLLTRIIQKLKKLYFSVRASSSVVKYWLF